MCFLLLCHLLAGYDCFTALTQFSLPFLTPWLLFTRESAASLPFTNVQSAHLHRSQASLLVEAPRPVARSAPVGSQGDPW